MKIMRMNFSYKSKMVHYYYDFENNWSKFVHLLKHPKFIMSSILYGRYCKIDNYDIREKPPVEIFTEYLLSTGYKKSDIKFIKKSKHYKKLAYEKGPDSYEWYFNVFDCTGVSLFFAVPLVSLYLNIEHHEINSMNICFNPYSDFTGPGDGLSEFFNYKGEGSHAVITHGKNLIPKEDIETVFEITNEIKEGVVFDLLVRYYKYAIKETVLYCYLSTVNEELVDIFRIK